jgi:hypothetical protein
MIAATTSHYNGEFLEYRSLAKGRWQRFTSLSPPTTRTASSRGAARTPKARWRRSSLFVAATTTDRLIPWRPCCKTGPLKAPQHSEFILLVLPTTVCLVPWRQRCFHRNWIQSEFTLSLYSRPPRPVETRDRRKIVETPLCLQRQRATGSFSRWYRMEGVLF